VVAVLAGLAAPSAATAQTQPSSSSRSMRPPADAPRWEISVQAGVLTAGVPVQGLAALPAPNPSFTAVNGTSSRHVPSWFIGDGTTLFNGVASALSPGVSGARITSLNAVVAGPSTDPGAGWGAGVRVARILNPRVSIEGTVEYSRSPLSLRKTAEADIEAARASFVSGWTALFATDPSTFQNTAVTATSTIDRGSTRQVVANGAIVFNIRTHRRNTPYLSAAVGVLSNGGRAPSVTLVGHYTARIDGTIPIDETDALTLRYAIDRTLVAVTVGLGLKRMVTDRWGVRIEMREQLCSNPITNLVSAAPQIVLASSGGAQGAVATPLSASLQLANIPNSSTLSSLGGSIAGLKVFTGTGMESRLSFSGGIFWRF